MKQFLSFGHVITIFLFFLWPSFISAQVIAKNGKSNPGVDYARLARIDNLVNDYIKKNWVKAVVTIVVKDNQLVQYKGYGLLDEETKKPMPNDAIFRIMSQTKAITSVGILMLYEEGRLLPDEPIADFIPEFRNPVVLDKYHAADTTYTTIPAKRDITFRDLLTHTSGIDYADIGTDNMNAIYAKAGVPSGLGYFDANLLDKMKVLAKQPLAFQPGEKWQYGLNTDLLGCLIEVISGMNLEDFFRKKIFEPLGMNDTYFNVPASKANRLATVYTEDSLHHIIKWSHHFRNIDPDYATMNKHYFSGGAGLSSTAWDYAIFLQMLLNKGTYNGHKILGPRTVEMMLSGQVDSLFNDTDNFGLGFEIVTPKGAAREPRNAGSFGWGGYFGTTYWADPKENLVYLIMTQHNPNSHSELTQKIEALIYASLKK
jgi:CubicO group peptidase (beta-lactamase class C family)